MIIQAPKPKIEENKNVNVTWAWYSQSKGIVQWTFTNNSSQEQDVILLRGAVDSSSKVLVDYYFGNAYWVVYLALGITNWQTRNEQLTYDNPQNNSPPLAIIQFGDKYLVSFEFTLKPKSTWSVLEGGFDGGIEPYNPKAIPANYVGDYYFCVGYDIQQVLDYTLQTGMPVTGYYPNPNTYKVSLYSVDAPYIQLYKDHISKGVCAWLDCINLIKKIVNSI